MMMMMMKRRTKRKKRIKKKKVVGSLEKMTLVLNELTFPLVMILTVFSHAEEEMTKSQSVQSLTRVKAVENLVASQENTEKGLLHHSFICHNPSSTVSTVTIIQIIFILANSLYHRNLYSISSYNTSKLTNQTC